MKEKMLDNILNLNITISYQLKLNMLDNDKLVMTQTCMNTLEASQNSKQEWYKYPFEYLQLLVVPMKIYIYISNISVDKVKPMILLRRSRIFKLSAI
jgi:hypothetical protein